jgi:hypothetical protein
VAELRTHRWLVAKEMYGSGKERESHHMILQINGKVSFYVMQEHVVIFNHPILMIWKAFEDHTRQTNSITIYFNYSEKS